MKHRLHQITVGFAHQVPAYLDEPYSISVDVTNKDEKDLNFTLDALLQPGEDSAGLSSATGLDLKLKVCDICS